MDVLKEANLVLIDEEETEVESHIETPRSDDSKCIRKTISFSTPYRFTQFNLGHRTIIFGVLECDGLSETDQLMLVRGVSKLVDLLLPTTSMVTPLAHLVFKICMLNICPRLGSRSNFSSQDLIIVAMILSGKPFDDASLILKNMLCVVQPKEIRAPVWIALNICV